MQIVKHILSVLFSGSVLFCVMFVYGAVSVGEAFSVGNYGQFFCYVLLSLYAASASLLHYYFECKRTHANFLAKKFIDIVEQNLKD